MQANQIDKSKIFVPLSLDGSGGGNGRIVSDKRMILGIAILILLGFGMVLTAAYIKLIGVKIVLLVLMALTVIITVRVIMLQEKVMLDLYKYQKENEVTNLSSVWDIYKMKNTGMIFYCSGIIGIIVEIVHKSVTCCSDAELLLFQMCKANMLREMGEAGFGAVILNRNSKVVDYTNLNRLEPLQDKYDNERLKDYSRKSLKYNRVRLSKSAKLEKEYMLINTGDPTRERDLLQFAHSIQNLLKGSVYGKHRVLNDKAALNYMREVLGMSFFDYNKLVEKVFVKNTKEKSNIKVYDSSISLMKELNIRISHVNLEEIQEEEIADKPYEIDDLTDEEKELIKALMED